MASLRPIVLAAALAIVLLGGPLLLHFGQKRHDHLVLDLPPVTDSASAPNGAAFANTLIALVDHELDGMTGWRPNDFFLWGPGLWADNNANRQLGIIQAVRESVRVFKDHLTKVSASQFDQNLVSADTAFRNDATKFWLPSAESKFRQGVDALGAYVAGLSVTPPTSKPINRRNVELIRLFQAWTDLLGDAHANLFKESDESGGGVPIWRTDDYFYHAQGFAHVLHYLLQATVREYHAEIAERPTVTSLFEEVAAALGKAAQLKPFIVLDGRPAGLFANHRRNLDAYIVEARQKMYSIREELEK